MVEQQIRTWDVLDERVLSLYRIDALLRQNFISSDKIHLAYADISLPIGDGQCMLEPKLEARMLQELGLIGNEKVLHIGSGSGFFAALLGGLALSVVSVEINKNLAEQATKNLATANCTNVEVCHADGINGFANKAPYDAIVLTGSVPKVKQILFDQLTNGGTLLAVVGTPPAMTLLRYTKLSDNSVIKKGILETDLPALCNVEPVDEFQF